MQQNQVTLHFKTAVARRCAAGNKIKNKNNYTIFNHDTFTNKLDHTLILYDKSNKPFKILLQWGPKSLCYR